MVPLKFPEIPCGQGWPGRSRWAAKRRPLGGREGSWRFLWEPLGIRDSPPGGGFFLPGTPLVAQNGSKRTENDCFPKGAGPAPLQES